MLRTKAQLLISCALFTTFASILIAHAQTPDSVTATGSAEATVEATDPIPAEVSEETSGGNKPLPLDLQIRVVNLAANISNRVEATVTRFEFIIVRIDSRLTKMEAEGYMTSDARFYLSEARKSLDGVKLSLVGIDEKVVAFTTSENYWMSWLDVRDTFRDIQTQLQSTKRLLSEALADMKLRTAEGPVQNGADESSQATTTQTQ
jgi:hypothetical protein